MKIKMTNTEKIDLLKKIKMEVISGDIGICHSYKNVTMFKATESSLADIGIYKPSMKIMDEYWFDSKQERLDAIDEAIAKFSNESDNMSIEEEIKSIEENLVKETERLKKLKSELNKPKTVEEYYDKYGDMYVILDSGLITDFNYYRADAYPSRQIAEKEKLRIRLIQWAYVLNGGEFEPKKDETAYYISISNDAVRVDYTDTNYRYGFVLFKTRELAEEAMSKFTKEELIKMLS